MVRSLRAPLLLLLLAYQIRGAHAAPRAAASELGAPIDANGAIASEPLATSTAGQWTLGSWVAYDDGPRSFGDERPLRARWLNETAASWSVHSAATLFVEAPLALFLRDSEPTMTEPGWNFAFGDVRVGSKLLLLAPERHGSFGLGLVSRVHLPTGARSALLASSSAYPSLRLLSQLNLVVATLRTQMGVLLRPTRTGHSADSIGEGSELPFAAALAIRPQAVGISSLSRWMVTPYVRGGISLNGATSTARCGGSVGTTLGDVTLLGAFEVPLLEAPALGTRVLFGVRAAFDPASRPARSEPLPTPECSSPEMVDCPVQKKDKDDSYLGAPL